MKKNYTKELTVLATLALFAPWASAQVDVDNVNVIGGVQNPGAITVNGDAFVQLPDTPAVPVPNPAGGLVNPNIDDDVTIDKATPVLTFLGSTETTKTSTQNSGVELTTDGNGFFRSTSGQTFSSTIASGTVVNINNADQDNGMAPGTPDPASQRYIPGYFTDASGNVIAPADVEAAPDPTIFDFNALPLDPLAPGYVGPQNYVPGVQDAIQAGYATQADLQNYINSLDPEAIGTQAGFNYEGPDGSRVVPDPTDLPGSGGNVDIDGNLELGEITDVEAAIGSNETAIGSNATDIGSNATDIGSNATDIGSNATDIGSNATDIGSNATDIGSNATDIGSNATDIGSNATDIGSNATDIGSNATDIGSNATDIGSNATDIGSNATDIVSNNTNIVSNDSAIQQEVADRSALIRDVGPNADGNQIVRIGDNSLITEELGGTQRLRAENGSGDEIPVRFDGSQGVYVDNYINVTAPDSAAEFTTNSSGAGSQLPSTESGTATTTPVVTVLGTTSGEQVDGASGGVLIENNGNVTLSQAGGQQSTVEFLQAVSFDVANPGEPNEGLAIAGTERYVAGYETSSGDFETLSPEFTTQAALDNWIATTDITDSAYDPIRQVETLEGSGGNLTVGGSAFLSGLQSSYNPDGDIEVEFDTVNSAITANGSAIAANSSAIANNSARISDNEDAIEENARGIAMVAALQNSTVLPGMTHALDVGAAHFEGETGMSLNYSRRINENVQINFGAASTTDFEESVIRAGVGVQW